MQNLTKLIFILMLTAALSACSGGGGTSTTTAQQTPTGGTGGGGTGGGGTGGGGTGGGGTGGGGTGGGTGGGGTGGGGTIDTTSPVITPPANITVNVASGTTSVPATDTAINAFLNSATATDNVDGTITNITNDAPVSFAAAAPTTVTFSATDSAGNTGTASATVTINVAVGGGGASPLAAFCPTIPNTTPATLKGWSWAQPSPQGVSLQTIVEGNGVFVAAGDHGQMVRSTDRVNWTWVNAGTQETIKQLNWDGSVFFASITGNILLSCDGLSWVKKPIQSGIVQRTTGNINHNIVFVNGKYISANAQSTDALNWVSYTTAAGKLAEKIIYNGTQLLAVRTDKTISVSNDFGATWQLAPTAPTPVTTKHVVWSGSLYYMYISETQYATSTDGLIWQTLTTTSNRIGFSTAWSPYLIHFNGSLLTYGGNDFLQVSSYNNNGGFGVLDATNQWNNADWQDTNNQGLLKVNEAIVTSTNTLLIVGDGGMIAEHTGAIPNQGAKSWVRYSNDISTLPLRSMASNGTSYVAVGDFGMILSSLDGYTWTKSTLPTYKPTAWLTIPIDKNFNQVHWTGTEYIAVGNNTTMLTSTDNGQTWTLNGVVQATGVPSVRSVIFNSALVRSDGYVMTKNALGVYRLGDNAGKFTRIDVSGGLAAYPATDFANNGTRYVSVGSYGITSTLNPTTAWTPVSITNIPSISTYSFTGIAYNGTKFLAAASLAANQILIESVDGLAWTQVTGLVGTPAIARPLRSGNGKFVSLGDIPKESVDGITWVDSVAPAAILSGWNNYSQWNDYLATPTHEFLIGYRSSVLIK